MKLQKSAKLTSNPVMTPSTSEEVPTTKPGILRRFKICVKLKLDHFSRRHTPEVSEAFARATSPIKVVESTTLPSDHNTPTLELLAQESSSHVSTEVQNNSTPSVHEPILPEVTDSLEQIINSISSLFTAPPNRNVHKATNQAVGHSRDASGATTVGGNSIMNVVPIPQVTATNEQGTQTDPLQVLPDVQPYEATSSEAVRNQETSNSTTAMVEQSTQTCDLSDLLANELSEEEKRWELVLKNHEQTHIYEVADLREEYEEKLADLRKGHEEKLQKIQLSLEAKVRNLEGSKVVLQKRVKKEVLAQQKPLESSRDKFLLEWVNLLKHAASLRHERDELADEVSSLRARNARQEEEMENLTAFLGDAKLNADEMQGRLLEMDDALKHSGNPNLVDQAGQLVLREKQVLELKGENTLLITESRSLRDQMSQQKEESNAKICCLEQDHQLALESNAVLQKRVQNLQDASEKLLAYPESILRTSKNARDHVMSEAYASIRNDNATLAANLKSTNAKHLAAQEDAAIWQARYQGLSQELSEKCKKFAELENTARDRDSKCGTLEIELDEQVRERDFKIREQDLALAAVKESLQRHREALEYVAHGYHEEVVRNYVASQHNKLEQAMSELHEARNRIQELEVQLYRMKFAAQQDAQCSYNTSITMKQLGHEVSHLEDELLNLKPYVSYLERGGDPSRYNEGSTAEAQDNGVENGGPAMATDTPADQFEFAIQQDHEDEDRDDESVLPHADNTADYQPGLALKSVQYTTAAYVGDTFEEEAQQLIDKEPELLEELATDESGSWLTEDSEFLTTAADVEEISDEEAQHDLDDARKNLKELATEGSWLTDGSWMADD